MRSILTFGEVLMRINPLQFKKFAQFPPLEFTFGGTEANVSISLSKLGFNSRHVSIFSDDFIGRAAENYLRGLGVCTREISFRQDNPMGIYFLEKGAVHRSSRISYNRSHSAFARLDQTFNWQKLFEGISYFHWTGVTAGISVNVYEELHRAVEIASKKNIEVTADISYRKNQWHFGKTAAEGLSGLMKNSSYLISGVPEMQEVLGESKEMSFEVLARRILEKFPNIKLVVDKQRSSVNASNHSIKGRIFDGEKLFQSRELEITHIVDRIGTGDAFAAGFIYAISEFENLEKVINFATAACALKHTIPGDANLSELEDIIQLMEGKNTGRIKR